MSVGASDLVALLRGRRHTVTTVALREQGGTSLNGTYRFAHAGGSDAEGGAGSANPAVFETLTRPLRKGRGEGLRPGGISGILAFWPDLANDYRVEKHC
jgi:hypothetical protein